jgi:hypothetical protein
MKSGSTHNLDKEAVGTFGGLAHYGGPESETGRHVWRLLESNRRWHLSARNDALEPIAR